MIRIISPTIKKAPAGRCIYCGATEGLSDEHILSFGLAGDSLILPSASCSGCQQATSKVETICLRHMWWPFRTQAGVPSRTAAPENFSLKRMRVNEYDAERDEIVDYTQLSMEDVPVEQYPIFYQTFEFPEPGVTAGRLASRDLSYSMWCKLEEQNFRARFGDQEGFRISPGRPEAFCRLLAKTAHAFAVAEFGDIFQPSLTNYIRGAPLDRLQWIGCPEVRAGSSALHDINAQHISIGDIDYLSIDLRLFGCIDSPVHRVIVGRLWKLFSSSLFDRLGFRVDFEGELPLRNAEVLRGRAEGWESV